MALFLGVVLQAACGSDGPGRSEADLAVGETSGDDGQADGLPGSDEKSQDQGGPDLQASDVHDVQVLDAEVVGQDVADVAQQETLDVMEPPVGLVPEAGFVEIEPVEFSVRSGWHTRSYTSSTARIWYAFQPADSDPESKPIAIFFNGGPGSATSLLFGQNTGKFTVDPRFTQGAPFGPNPYSWTQFANLLYVDARETGFSYNMIFDAYIKASRKNEFGTKNFNSLFDGADFIRVLLRFMAGHPALQDNPVIIVGESYGGIRGTVMGYLLLNYSEMGNGKLFYQDKALSQEIQTHFDAVFPEMAGQRVTREKVAAQFGHMVLIQPLLSGEYQSEIAGQMFRAPDSVIQHVAQQTGLVYEPCPEGASSCNDEESAMMFVYEQAQRDLYNVSQPLGWMDQAAFAINKLLVDPATLSALLQVPLEPIVEFFSHNRLDAYRWGTIPFFPDIELPPTPALFPRLPAELPPAARMEAQRAGNARRMKADAPVEGLDALFGVLRSWDEFFVGLHEDVNRAFYMGEADYLNIQPYDSRYGEMFLYDIRYIKTLVTRAEFDIVIYAPAIPEALCMHTDLVSECAYQPGLPEPRQGTVTFTYLPNAFGTEQGPLSATVLFPSYLNSGHPVEVTEPELLLEDVLKLYEGE